MIKNNRKGFTITELVIVIAVIAILAAVLIPTFGGIINKANDSAVLQGARARYTTYTAEWDYTAGSPAQNLIIEKDGKWVVVKGAQMQDEVYKTLDDAKLKAEANATILCEDHLYDVEDDANADTNGKCNDCTDVCKHTFADADATSGKCTTCGYDVPAAT